MNLVVSELLTHYTRMGKGKLVVIVPGWADTSASWQEVQKDLSASYDVVVVDLPGFGGSQMPARAWGLPDYAAFIGHFIAKLGAGTPYALIGHSNGGAIAIKGLAGGVLTSQKLVLIASAGVRGQDPGRKSLLKLIAKTGKVLSAPLPRRAREQLRRKLYEAAGSDMLVAEHMQETFKQVVAADVQADAATLSLPALLIYGDTDSETPLSYGENFHGHIKNSQLKIVPGAGHFVYVDQLEVVLTCLKDFLQT